jgi:hypothetical protein
MHALGHSGAAPRVRPKAGPRVNSVPNPESSANSASYGPGLRIALLPAFAGMTWVRND